eukprot:c21482_g1_i2 orf=234-1283(+)
MAASFSNLHFSATALAPAMMPYVANACFCFRSSYRNCSVGALAIPCDIGLRRLNSSQCAFVTGALGSSLPRACVQKRKLRYRLVQCMASVNGTGAIPGLAIDLQGPVLFQMLRAFCFYALTYIVAVPLFVVMLVVHPFVMVLDKHKRKAHHLINKVWANITISPFYTTQIEGLDNLPEPDEPAVYVSNHQSFLDIYTLLLLGRPFKFISKTSNFFIPIIGWSMYLTGHIPLHRMDTKSQIECFRHCLTLVKQGVSLVFFPEGTRSKDGKMAYFKKGAFTVAVKGKLPVIPVSLIGTGKLMPNGFEYTLRPGSVKAVIHPPLRGSNPDDLCEQARAVISDCLLKHGSEVY